MPPSIAPASRVRADLDALADAVDAATFRFSTDNARAERRDRVSALLRRYLVPRLADPEGPLLVALFGSTGSGKSTLVNSLAGRDVSIAGALRPTTRA
ncbi:MAG: 50S ribosome-binding GTPase, partial [Acidimicrobiia bacterium]|nr:50S ribosome-binding GTPase [Acidimicrobiia bacterium]